MQKIYEELNGISAYLVKVIAQILLLNKLNKSIKKQTKFYTLDKKFSKIGHIYRNVPWDIKRKLLFYTDIKVHITQKLLFRFS